MAIDTQTIKATQNSWLIPRPWNILKFWLQFVPEFMTSAIKRFFSFLLSFSFVVGFFSLFKLFSLPKLLMTTERKVSADNKVQTDAKTTEGSSTASQASSAPGEAPALEEEELLKKKITLKMRQSPKFVLFINIIILQELLKNIEYQLSSPSLTLGMRAHLRLKYEKVSAALLELTAVYVSLHFARYLATPLPLATHDGKHHKKFRLHDVNEKTTENENKSIAPLLAPRFEPPLPFAPHHKKPVENIDYDSFPVADYKPQPQADIPPAYEEKPAVIIENNELPPPYEAPSYYPNFLNAFRTSIEVDNKTVHTIKPEPTPVAEPALPSAPAYNC